MRRMWQLLWQRSKQAGLLMVGVSDYQQYLAHMRMHHPDHAVMSEAQWISRAQEARFGGRKMGKCPC